MYILVAFFAPILHSLSCIIDAHFSNSIFNKTTSLIFLRYHNKYNYYSFFIFVWNSNTTFVALINGHFYSCSDRCILSNSILYCFAQG